MSGNFRSGPGNFLSPDLVAARTVVSGSPGPRSAPRLYLFSFAAALLASVLSFICGLAFLSHIDRLPPPPLSGTWCIDEKLRWLKDHPESRTANFVAVGSSVTWRNLDFSVLSPAARSALGGIVNAAPCVLRVHQTRFMVEYLIERRPEIHTVMTILSPRDMEQCSTEPAAFFDPSLADSYFDGRVLNSWIYFRNLRLRSFVEDVVYLPERRSELAFDPFGATPLTNDAPLLWYPFKPEPSCYRELRSLAAGLHDRNVQFIVVTLPVMPDWAKTHDPSGATLEGFHSGVHAALAGTNAVLVDAQKEQQLPTSAFADPAHLQWREANAFTARVWERARELGAALPPASLGAEPTPSR